VSILVLHLKFDWNSFGLNKYKGLFSFSLITSELERMQQQRRQSELERLLSLTGSFEPMVWPVETGMAEENQSSPGGFLQTRRNGPAGGMPLP